MLMLVEVDWLGPGGFVSGGCLLQGNGPDDPSGRFPAGPPGPGPGGFDGSG